MNHKLQMRVSYLFLRLRMNLGNKSVIIGELVKAHNLAASARMRRRSDYSVQGWRVIQS